MGEALGQGIDQHGVEAVDAVAMLRQNGGGAGCGVGHGMLRAGQKTKGDPGVTTGGSRSDHRRLRGRARLVNGDPLRLKAGVRIMVDLAVDGPGKLCI
ncbi:hypothetical protein JANAI62_16580 [Jannaschia pagri]|uniref:Uncharacterized protein n=1 Tax=Jannaschia pagri TaxID=2829797 RepID=A0ABQ4NKT8_9RHOB|nr:hypothetical protein JANAI61_16610 [Jannaschia sp. AI_61]GIT95035.1 hypothetical protein JANAI62_16580 [Jannaschia sp. AI_62]